ncbi:MAG: bifunctional precorrin-2 dehydrogenase/sirohydrochlorin ferrochelatase [Geobacter sp.]|nr:bifunctional precorrin-2 dehydrogenase/sirohydrochlorin ferrochelatase [Geobacter sp.]
MRYLPINIDVSGKAVTIVGGGDVAARKCRTLLQSGARVTVISPATTTDLETLHNQHAITWVAREYRPGDLDGAFLVFACTPEPAINLAVVKEASERNSLCNIADCPDRSSFISPAVFSRGDLTISVSTGGKSPAFAARIRREMESRYGDEYGVVVDLLGKVREKLLTSSKNGKYNRKLLLAVAELDLAELVRAGNSAALDNALRECLGPGFTLRELGMDQRIAHE